MATDPQLEDLAELASACIGGPAPSPVSYHDKRRHDRIRFPARVMLVELDSSDVPGASFGGEAMDISRSGIGLCTRRLYYPGRRVLIRIAIPQRSPCIKCGVVRHVRYCAGGLHHVGVEFCTMPDSAAVQAWIRGAQSPD